MEPAVETLASRRVPAGSVTFLFTDIEGSTRLWETQFAAMQEALRYHDAALREAIEANHGRVVKTTGDGVYAAFDDAAEALAATLAAQRALAAASADRIPLRSRMALHTGVVEGRDGDYHGPVINRTARLMAAGHGGQILLSQETTQLVRDRLPDGVTLRDMGERRLKDLVRPEHVYQVVAADLPADFPPLRTLDARANNLPVQPTPFIGRERDAEALRDRVRAARLVTLTGPGGTGKTRLALHVAAEMIDEFEHGVFLVELASLHDSQVVLPAIADAIGVRETGERGLTSLLRDHLRDREVLLVLDNFEQVMAAAADVAGLLTTSQRLKIVVTSREALRVGAESEYPVATMPTPDPQSTASVGVLLRFESVALFAQRAAVVRPGFAVTPANAQAIAGICRRLEGLPLAIELAAARIRILAPDAILAALDHRLRFLREGARDLPARQRTLRGAIDWSYDLLSEAERTLFTRLAVMAGTCSIDAVEAVCNVDEDDDILTTLESVVAKSLARDIDFDGETRFGMLETIREFAYERLVESGEDEVLRTRHQRYFLGMAEHANRQLTGTEQAQWLSQLEREHENLRAAFDSTLDLGDLEAAQRFCAALRWFWYTRGHLTEGRAWCDRALSSGAARTPSYANALETKGVLAYYQADYAVSRAIHEECLALHTGLGDESGIARSLLNLGNVAQYQGDYATAKARFEERLALDRKTGNRSAMTPSLNNLANIALDEADIAKARALFEEGLAIVRESGDISGIATYLVNLGPLAKEEGDLAGAEVLIRESLALWRQLESPGGTAAALLNLADISIARRDAMAATNCITESLGISRELGDVRFVAIALQSLGAVAMMQGYPLCAAESWAAAATLRDRMGSPLPPRELRAHEDKIGAARAAAGAEAFDGAWQQGTRKAVDDVVLHVLQTVVAPTAEAP